MALSFAFDPEQGETPESLKRKRLMAQALAQGVRPASNVGEGLATLGNAIAYRMMMNEIAAGETAGRSSAAQTLASLFDFPDAPKASSVAKALIGKKDDPNVGSTIDFARAGKDGVGDDYFAAIRTAESGGNDRAKNPRSSATGRYQFIESTWSNLAQKYPDLGLTPDGRTDPAQQERAIRAFTRDNAQALSAAGIPVDGGSLYAAHFLGADGAKQVLSADPSASVASIVGDRVVRANPFLSSMSVADFQRWASRKGGGAPVQNRAPANQVASLDPSSGLPQRDPYANIPALDTRGEDQRAKFRQWNSDPAGNEAANSASIDPALSQVVQRAKQIAGSDFVIGSGRRTPEQQRQAVQWGWSKTEDSDHLGGGAVDLWPVDANGAVVFDPQKQQQIVAAMKQAAGELGVDLEAGADWTRFKDMPHFGMPNQTPLDNAPVPTPRPGGNQVASLDPRIGLPAPAGRSPAAALGEGRPGDIRQGPDGRTYQYVETTGIAGATGDFGWVPVNVDQQTAGLFVGTPEELDAQRRAAPQGASPAPVGRPPAQNSPAPVQVAQEGPEAFGFGPAINSPAGADARLMQLRRALANEWLNDTERSVIASEIEQIQQANDPVRRLQIMRLEQEVAEGRRKQPIEIEGRLLDPDTYEVLADFSKPAGRKTVVINGRLVDEQTGQEIANFPEAPKAPTPTELARLIQERNALAPNDPQREVYDQAIAKEAGGSGMSLRTNEDGTIELYQGAGAKPFTEGQSKDNVYATRARGSLPTADQYADLLADFGDRVLDVDPTGVARGNLQNPDYQIARTAADEFLQAILRKDTGAAITAQEQELYGRTYFPVPGDLPAVRAYKKEARERAVAAIEAGMSPTQIIAQERAIGKARGISGLEPTTQAQPAAPGKKQPVTIDGYTIEQVD